MDLVYIPEVLTYGSFRCPQYRDYEQPWNNDYFGCGKSLNCQRQQQEHHNHRQQRELSKGNCPMCKESKRRSLAAYIRSKSRNSCQEICEEEEEEGANAKGEECENISDTSIPDSDKTMKTTQNTAGAKVTETVR